ncbi:vasoactive intestinal polypeptide receptor 2-like [Pseudoliparis swirei]|uniref:vasoactive intestinal polypeptide receptor 2-like n=1 Tax=Pseudoliparis swirei TaxID=2059687 RepID=UPI0024BE4FF2|nr:vasoactive intestinal polypeptide receptor 2-like [Pseudoliparis swirei]
MAFTPRLALLLLGVTFIHTVHGKFPHCQLQWEMQRASRECGTLLQQTAASTGCLGEWDNVSCWQRAAVGEVMTLPCPSPILRLFGKNGNLSRNCTQAGWSSVYPPMDEACWSTDPDQPNELVFYRVVKILSTLGHSLSFITLLTSSSIISVFRRLRCTRNYIHLNLFLSFMLRAAAVLTKDALLLSEDPTADCSTQPSLVGCKAVLLFFNYFVMANFLWLLVEALYLHLLLLSTHRASTRIAAYLLIGWGIPFVFMTAWIICRIHLEDTECWEMNENPIPRRLMNWPIMASIIINFLLFVSIIRILVQKLRCTDVGGNERSQYRRLARSTLLLIPLFGVNYVALVSLTEPTGRHTQRLKIFCELGLGSFQGLIVAVLYCFLNSEVQMELKRAWRGLSLERYGRRDFRPHAASVSRSGLEGSARFPRSCRAQSILQTETTGL